MGSNAMMESFLARYGGKGVESKEERAARVRAERMVPDVVRSHTVPIKDERDAVLVRLDRAIAMLAEAETIQQTKAVLDVAYAAKVYAERQKEGEKLTAQARSIIVYAEAKLGEMLKNTPRNAGTRKTKKLNDITGGTLGDRQEPRGHGDDMEIAPTLKDMGISKRLSVRAKKLAGLSPEDLQALAATKPERKARGSGDRHKRQCPACGHEW